MIKKTEWNQNEEQIFIEAHKIHGNKWAEISKYIPGRTDNQIKNNFYCTLRKIIGKLKKFEFSEDIFNSSHTIMKTIYFLKYLRKINEKNDQNQKPNDLIFGDSPN